MTNKELIEKLSKLPPDLPVCFDTEGNHSVCFVEVDAVCDDATTPYGFIGLATHAPHSDVSGENNNGGTP